jgi:hypothetical protein
LCKWHKAGAGEMNKMVNGISRALAEVGKKVNGWDDRGDEIQINI